MTTPPILSLGDTLARVVEPASFPSLILRYRNDQAARTIGLGGLSDEAWVGHFGQFEPLADNLVRPLALAYHGHQFRAYNPDIGDGRGFLFAQLRDEADRLMDLGTKGSGQTPFSRTGDGRLTLKGAFREILATEMLEALGVPTSRTLSVIETGDALHRHDEPSPARGAVLVRLSHSHIRIGSFQRLAFLEDTTGLENLLNYAITQFYPDLDQGDAAGFLKAVSERVATATARLMAAGFVHGVLNTDNINITGEVFDFGPWRFLPRLQPDFVAAYFDHGGLYAYGRQADAVYRNLAALGDALRPLADDQALRQALGFYPDQYGAAFAHAVLRRLALKGGDLEADQAFASDLFSFLHETQLPFEQAFFDLRGGRANKERRDASPYAATYGKTALIGRLDAYTPDPHFASMALGEAPPTLLIEEVEALWDPIAERDDWTLFEQKIAAIRAYGEALGLSAQL